MTNSLKILGLFPGQGSQQVGMGRELYNQFELARSRFDEADRALGFSLSKICFEGPAEKLTETAITQPAILAVSVICYELACQDAGGKLPLVAAAGHSLGEYSALVAAGALSFADAIVLVHKRGSYMQEAVPAGAGKMVAVLGKELEEIEKALAETQGVASVANFNAPGQIVVAGSREGIDEFLVKLGSAKAKELPVSAPFHCALMKPAEEKLAQDLEAIDFTDCEFPVYANYHAEAVRSADEIRKALKLQVCGQVKWVDCMQNAIAQESPSVAIEFGAGNVLTGLLRRIAPGLERRNVSSPDTLAISLAA